SARQARTLSPPSADCRSRNRRSQRSSRPSRFRKQADDPALRQRRRRFGERLTRYVAGRRRSAAIDRIVIVAEPALPAGPAIEEAAFGQFLIVGDHDIELTPFAPR